MRRCFFVLLSVCSSCVRSGAVEGPADTHCDAPTAASSAPRYGEQADDDACKYHLIWTSTQLTADNSVTFVVQINVKADGSFLEGAQVRAELSLGGVQAPSSDTHGREFQTGNYTFAAFTPKGSGDWLLRFYINEQDPAAATQATFLFRVP